jgi:FkbM family methyltransferase
MRVIDYYRTFRDFKIHTVLFIGSNDGVELDNLMKLTPSIICVDPLVEKIHSISFRYPSIIVLPVAISSSTGVSDFYVANNGGRSSSLSKPTKHLEVFKSISFTKKTKVITIPLRILLNSFENIDFMLIDAQGSDLEILESGNGDFSNVKVIIIEALKSDLYGVKTYDSIINFLGGHNFILIGENQIHSSYSDLIFINGKLHKNLEIIYQDM